jgi:hypothetical protein
MELPHLSRPRGAFRCVVPELLHLPRLLEQSGVLDWSCRIYHDYFKFQWVGLELTAHVAVRVALYMEDTLWGAVSFAASHALRKVLELVTLQNYVFVVSSTIKCAWLLEYEPGGQSIGGEVEPW